MNTVDTRSFIHTAEVRSFQVSYCKADAEYREELRKVLQLPLEAVLTRGVGEPDVAFYDSMHDTYHGSVDVVIPQNASPLILLLHLHRTEGILKMNNQEVAGGSVGFTRLKSKLEPYASCGIMCYPDPKFYFTCMMPFPALAR